MKYNLALTQIIITEESHIHSILSLSQTLSIISEIGIIFIVKPTAQ